MLHLTWAVLSTCFPTMDTQSVSSSVFSGRRSPISGQPAPPWSSASLVDAWQSLACLGVLPSFTSLGGIVAYFWCDAAFLHHFTHLPGDSHMLFILHPPFENMTVKNSFDFSAVILLLLLLVIQCNIS